MKTIEYEEIKAKTGFYLQKKYNIQKGFLFWITRKLWSFEAQGKPWQIILFYSALFIVLLPISISLDIVALIILSAIKLFSVALKGFWKLLQQIIKALFTKLLYPMFRNILTVTSIIILIIIIVYRFYFIRNTIINLFDALIK